MMRRFTHVFGLVFFAATPIVAGEKKEPAKELAARSVRLVHEAIPLSEALKILHQETGNMVVDRRKLHRADPRLRLQVDGATFWQALDEIVHQAGCGYSVYQDDAAVALIDTPMRKTPVIYAGLFRLAVKRVAATRDEDSGSHFCNLILELAWEPRFEPFFVDAGAIEASYSLDGAVKRVKQVASGKANVAGRGATEIEVRFPAPPRSVPALTSLEGTFAVVGPSKMLTFTFADLKAGLPARKTQDDVQVAVKPKSLQGKPWSFEVTVVNPPGWPRFESYLEDAWIANNRITLGKTLGDKTETIAPLPSVPELLTATQANWIYYFAEKLPASPSGWSVVYRTPARIVEVPGTYGFKNVPLP